MNQQFLYVISLIVSYSILFCSCRSTLRRQTTIPYPNVSRGQRGGHSGSERTAQRSTTRRRENFIVNKTLVIVPDPLDTSVPTHSRRAQLRVAGLIIDEFPFDKRWPDDELLLNVMEQLPLNLATRRLRFVKASYGSLAPINLANGVPLTCERLLRISGQGAIYAQLLPRENDRSNSTHTAIHQVDDSEEEDNATSIIGNSDAEPLPQSYSTISRPSTVQLGGTNRSSPLPVSTQESAASSSCDDDYRTDPNEIYLAIKGIFPDSSDELLRACANEHTHIREAVDAVLNYDTSLSSILEEMKKRVDCDQPITFTVRRENMWRDCLSFYKVAMVEKRRLFRDLKIEFEGEDGVDCGALRLEFFQTAFDEAKKILLEEVGETMIPKKTSASLLAFKVLGTFLGHSILQDGHGMHCFPEWVFEFLSSGEFQSAAEMIFSEKQIPLNAATALLHTLIEEIRKADSQEQLDDLLDESTSNGQVNAQIVNGSSWDITRQIKVEDRDELISELLVDELLRKRIAQLTAIRQGLEISGILRYIILHPKVMSKLFLPATKVTIEAVLASFDTHFLPVGSKQYNAFHWLLRFVETASEEKLEKILKFTTSLKRVAPTGLSPKIEVTFHATEEKLYPEAAVCFRQLSLPICHCTYDDFARYFDQAVLLGSEGFGLM